MADASSFSVFFTGWLVRQQSFLDQLLVATQPENHNTNGDLIERVLGHYAEYYEEKSRLIWQDILLVLSPPWLSSFEKTFIWVGGFKPSLAFSIVGNFIELEEEQLSKIRVLKSEIGREEKMIVDDFANVQESVGFQPLMSDFKKYGRFRLVDGEMGDFDEAMEKWKVELARIVQNADNLRRKTVIKVMGILSVGQSLKFLAFVGKYHLGVRAWGLHHQNLHNRN